MYKVNCPQIIALCYFNVSNLIVCLESNATNYIHVNVHAYLTINKYCNVLFIRSLRCAIRSIRANSRFKRLGYTHQFKLTIVKQYVMFYCILFFIQSFIIIYHYYLIFCGCDIPDLLHYNYIPEVKTIIKFKCTEILKDCLLERLSNISI